MVGAKITDSILNEPVSFPDSNKPAQVVPTTTMLKYTIPSYTTVDAAIGVAKDIWNVELAATNLTKNDAATNITSGQFINSVSQLRPRVVTLSFGLKFCLEGVALDQ